MEYDPTRPLVRQQAAFEKYFDVEKNSMAMEGYSTKQEALDKRKRALILLDQLTKAGDIFIRYLALSYFDRFASREQLQDQDLALAIICCISLASKMRNNFFSIDLLLINRPDLNVNENLIMEMEVRILTALDWRLRSVNALNFVKYFLQMFPDDMRPSPKLVNDIIIQAERDIVFTQFRPSVIAASAIITASSVRFPGRLQECFDIIMSSKHVNKEELKRGSEMYREKHILAETLETGEESISEPIEDSKRRSEEEPMLKWSKTMEELQIRPGQGTIPENSNLETMEVIQRKPGKEPMHESLRVDEKFKSEWSKLVNELDRGPEKELKLECSETMEEILRRPEKKLMPDRSETMKDSQRKPEEEPVSESSETMGGLQRKPGKETFPESSETMESIPTTPEDENVILDDTDSRDIEMG